MSIEDGYTKKGRKAARNGGGRGADPRPRRENRRRPPEEDFLDEDYRDEDYLDEDFLDEDYQDEDFPEGDFPEEDLTEDLDLFDDVDLDQEGAIQEDSSIAGDPGMEDKIFGQAMSDKRDRNGGSGRKAPRELNTAGSTVDQKRLKREQEQKKKSRVRKIIFWTVLELFTLCLIFGYGFVIRTFSRMPHPEVNRAAIENENLSMEKKKEMEGYWNFYVFGVDGRNSAVGKGLNSDVIMLASINQDTGDIKLVSIFRDTYLNISEKNQYNKINQAYAQGGPEQAIAALNKNLDLNVTNYVTFNWEAVAHGINILGGVDDIDISKAELYYINAYITETVKATGIGSHQLTHTGPQHLDGIHAVSYARLRLMDSDFARTERQREIIEACFKKAKTADFAVLNNILVDCFPMVAIDIPLSDLVRMAQSITKYNIADTGGFPWSRGDANIPKKGACVIPTSLESNVKMLHEFLFGDEDYQPSDAVLRYSEKIKEDSSLYKEGKPVESVGTDNGVIQKPKTTAADEDEDEKETTKDRDKDKTYETDEDGNRIYETDEDGETIYPTDEDGKPIKPSESSQASTRPTRPTSLMEGDEETTEGDAGSEIVDDEGNVLGTSPVPGQSGSSSHNRPTSTVDPTGGNTPGGNTPGSNTPGGSHSTNPTSSTRPSTVTPAETTAARPTEVIPDEPQTVAPSPGGAEVVSPTKPAPTVDNSGPGAVSPAPGGSSSQGGLTPEGQPVAGPGV